MGFIDGLYQRRIQSYNVKPRIMLSGNGAFAHSTMQILRDKGAEVSCYLTRANGNF